MIKPGDFYEDDELFEDVLAALETGEPLRTVAYHWRCPHFDLSSSLILDQPRTGCGCEMTAL